jgi:hypothetical protein
MEDRFRLGHFDIGLWDWLDLRFLYRLYFFSVSICFNESRIKFVPNLGLHLLQVDLLDFFFNLSFLHFRLLSYNRSLFLR